MVFLLFYLERERERERKRERERERGREGETERERGGGGRLAVAPQALIPPNAIASTAWSCPHTAFGIRGRDGSGDWL